MSNNNTVNMQDTISQQQPLASTVTMETANQPTYTQDCYYL